MIRWLARKLYVAYLRHEVSYWDIKLNDEMRRHEEYPSRMRSWWQQRAPYKARLDRLENKVKVDYHHGPCLRRTPPMEWLP